MNFTLSPQLEQLVNDQIKSGQYCTVDEVMAEALRLLDEKDRRHAQLLKELHAEIAVGMEQSDNEDVVDGEEVIAELRRKTSDLRRQGR